MKNYIVSFAFKDAYEWRKEYNVSNFLYIYKATIHKLDGLRITEDDKVFFVGNFKNGSSLDEIILKLGERGWDGVPAEWPEKVEDKPKPKVKITDYPLIDRVVTCGDPFCPYCKSRNSPYMKPHRPPERIDFSEYELARMKESDLREMLGRYGFTRYDTVRDPTKFTTTIIGYYD